MKSFHDTFAAAQRRQDIARRIIGVGMAVSWLATLAVFAAIIFVGVKAAIAGPEAIAAMAGRAVAAFDQARATR